MLCTAVQEIVTPVTLHSLRTPATLDRVRVWGAEVVATAQTVPKATRPDVWLGETGSAQAGGQSGGSADEWGWALAEQVDRWAGG